MRKIESFKSPGAVPNCDDVDVDALRTIDDSEFPQNDLSQIRDVELGDNST